jgi:hypothetical protein
LSGARRRYARTVLVLASLEKRYSMEHNIRYCREALAVDD